MFYVKTNIIPIKIHSIISVYMLYRSFLYFILSFQQSLNMLTIFPTEQEAPPQKKWYLGYDTKLNQFWEV